MKFLNNLGQLGASPSIKSIGFALKPRGLIIEIDIDKPIDREDIVN